MVIVSSTTTSILSLIISVVILRHSRTQSVSFLNFQFCLLTTWMTGNDLLFFTSPSFLFSSSLFHDVIPNGKIFTAITLGYLLVDLTLTMVVIFVDDKENADCHKTYFLYHFIIFLSYFSVLLNGTGEPVVLLTLFGELSSVILDALVYGGWHRYLILKYIYWGIFFLNRCCVAAFLCLKASYELLFDAKSFLWIEWLQLIFLFNCLGFNCYWMIDMLINGTV